VNEINEVNKNTWEAGFNDYFMDMSFAEINKRAGLKRNTEGKLRANANWNIFEGFNSFISLGERITNTIQESYSSFIQGAEVQNDFRQYLDTPISQIATSSLPKNWDWRDVDGENFVPDLKEQGSCGSCYAMAAITTLESRIRVATNNKDRTPLSTQFVITCSPYTEGCDGGYPELIGKFGKDYELVAESCMPYKANTKLVRCSEVCDYTSHPKQYKVKDYYFVGGYYGGCNEEAMMKEIYARGPIVGSFEPAFDFSFYQRGVYSNNHNKVNFLQEESKGPSRKVMKDYNREWEKVDHSIVIVGWGEEDNKKYWICMNTWGPTWGEHGFFRIKRGTDESSIESIAVALIPEIKNRA